MSDMVLKLNSNVWSLTYSRERKVKLEGLLSAEVEWEKSLLQLTIVKT